MLTLQQLRNTVTRSQALEWLLTVLTSLGFETTGWQNGRIQKTLLLTVSTLGSDFTELVKATVEFGFLAFATGEPLNEYSKSRFNRAKDPAVATEGPAKLTSTASIPYTIDPGQLIASTTNGAQQFRNTTGGTLAAGPSTLTLQWKAITKGAAGNVGLGAINRLLTPLAGVTVSNDTGNPWYTVTGRDEESDASVRSKDIGQWSQLSVEHIAEWYEAVARNAGAAKVALDDQNPRGPGTINVYSAGEANLLSTEEMETIQEEFARRTFGTDDTWPASDESRTAVKHPPTQALNLTGTIYYDPSYTELDMSIAVEEVALVDFVRATPLGGYKFPPALSNVITLASLHEVLEAVEGVRTVVLSSPTGTISVGTLSLVTRGTWSFTYVPVTATP